MLRNASTLSSDIPTEGVGKEIQQEVAPTYEIEPFGSPGSPPSTPSDVTDTTSISCADVIAPGANSEIQHLREKCKAYKTVLAKKDESEHHLKLKLKKTGITDGEYDVGSSTKGS